MIPATLAIGAILAALLATMALLGSRRAAALLAPEVRRKLLHVAMGCVTLFLPFIFDDAAHVWWLAGLAFGILLIIRSVDLVKASIGGAIHTVGRKSFGELCYPLGVATLFSLAGDDYLLYLVPMLILTFGDSLAALVGIYHGRQRYPTLDGHKTIEGSSALFGVSLLCVLVPYGLGARLDPATLLLIAVNLALLVTLVEAVTWRGIDNFVLPVIAFYLLEAYLPLDAGSLLSQTLLNGSLLLTLLMWHRVRLAEE